MKERLYWFIIDHQGNYRDDWSLWFNRFLYKIKRFLNKPNGV
jgi:hypothetical protein